MTRRRIAVVTTSRADFSHLCWPLKELRSRPEFEVRLIAMGAHLSPEFGQTVREILQEGFTVDEQVESLLSSDTDVGMAKSIGVATLGLAEVLGRLRPDVLLLIADRYELLAPASVALALRIPIAHIEGGEVSEGAIDDAVRNAVTKMSHVHFAPTEAARRRIVGMGEADWRVHRTGAPSLDHLRRGQLPSRAEIESRLGMEFQHPTILVAYHPVTIARDTLCETDELFAALEPLEGVTVFCFPNADAGSRALIARARAFCERREKARIFVNLSPLDYWSLLSQVDLMIGNSSSGIMETPTLRLPTVNVGFRQRGRERARNIVDAAPDRASIAEAVARAGRPEFRAGLDGMENPYGDGRASERIAEILASIPLGPELLWKRSDQLRSELRETPWREPTDGPCPS